MIMCHNYYNLIEKQLAVVQYTWSHRILRLEKKRPYKLASSVPHFIGENKEA